jgi:hypothetical protein
LGQRHERRCCADHARQCTDTNAYANRQPDCHCNGDPNTYAYSDRDANSNGNGNCYSDSYSKCDT